MSGDAEGTTDVIEETTTTEVEAGAEGAEEAEGQETPKRDHVQERIDKEVGKRKELEERLSTVEQERDTLKTQIQDLESAAGANVPLDPSYLSRTERELIESANALEMQERKLEENPDGIEGDQRLDGPAKVRAELVRVRQELRRIAVKADAVYERAKAQQMADLKEVRALRLAREKAKQGKPAGEERPATTLGGGGGAAPKASVKTPKGPDVQAFEKAGGTKAAAARELAKLIPD